MSAETPRRTRSQTSTSSGPVTVTPQQVNDRSIIDSVAGFINEVVPTAYSAPTDTKDQVQWMHFEYLDRNQSTYSDSADCESGIPAPLIIVLGYGSGIQVWAVPINGDATEILSWRHGSVRVLRILPNPASSVISDKVDLFADKRPLMVLCDTATPGPQYFSLSFISLKTGDQVKSIKFKNPVLDVLANKRSVVVTFAERIAIFDAHTLEDRLTVTTCFLSPGLYPNPVALGTRWLAYAEKKLIPARRSGGGNEGEGVQSYTATVLHAAKSLGKGLRELGETVASSLAGTTTTPTPAQPAPIGAPSDLVQPGIVTILDLQNTDSSATDRGLPVESVVAHFTAHSEAIVAMQFDPTGMLLLTADKRGHDFHLFRIQPHPGGPSLAAVHHLYILHRGDTSARVQNMCFSPDSRWVAVSTLRGTTHVFPVTPYGGPVGMRTHATPHIVNRMSRFHRSAGLPVEGRSNSPVSQLEIPVQSGIPYRNPRLPPYPHSTVVHPLAQLRQQLNLPITGAGLTQRSATGRSRLGSSSDDSPHVALRVAACFAAPRAWLDTINQSRDPGHKQRRPVESLFIISSHGTLIQYDLEPRHAHNVPKERICDDTPVELKVNAKAQWTLQRHAASCDIQAPLGSDSLLLYANDGDYESRLRKRDYTDDRWLSQVEIVTHAGPHRRLWMGPQFTFKTYNGTNGTPVSVLETEVIDVGVGSPVRPARSKPLNMPEDGIPVLIESGSASSFEQSPRLLDREVPGTCGESQLKEDLADAMLESPGRVRGDNGGRCVLVSVKHNAHIVAKVVNPLGTVVTLPSDPGTTVATATATADDEVIIHENCDESLFRPVMSLIPPPVCPARRPNTTTKSSATETEQCRSHSNERYQGLQHDEIVHPDPVELPAKPVIAGRKNKKVKHKLGVRVNNPVVVEKPAEEHIEEPIIITMPDMPVVEDPVEEMFSSMEESKLDRMDSSFTATLDEEPLYVQCEISAELETEYAIAEDAFDKPDEETNLNNNGSQTETTESDDSAKNKVELICSETVELDEGVVEVCATDDSSSLPAITAQQVQKTSKKRAKKKRK